MIAGIILVAILSSFAVGPASFNIIRNLISTERWPWSSIAGFLVGDLAYVGLAIVLLQSPLFRETWLKTFLTTLTAVVLFIYAVRIMTSKEKAVYLEVPASGFMKSLFLTLSNFHLILIYAGFFVHFDEPNPGFLFIGVGIYVCAFITGFMLFLWGLQLFRSSLRRFLRKIEFFTACGFLSFSIYLFTEIL